MKRVITLVLITVVLFLLADLLHAWALNQISQLLIKSVQQSTPIASFLNSVWPNLTVLTVIYGAVGIVLGSLTFAPGCLLLGFTLGLLAPLSTLLFVPPLPFMWISHAPLWIEVLCWGNWYVPPIASLFGTLIGRICVIQLAK